MNDRILILDYGSQFTQLIARRVREAHVYSEIHPASRSLDWIREFAPRGIILSGGPNSVYDAGAPLADPGLLQLGVPVLGLCYGMQLMAHLAGARVVSAARRYLADLDRRFRDVQEGPDGLVYVVTDEADRQLLRLRPD